MTEAELLAFCRVHLSTYTLSRTVEFRAQLPISGAGMRRALRDP